MRNLCFRWMSDVAMNTWRWGRSATRIASTARCGSPSRQRASAATAMPPFVSRAIRWTASKSPGEAAGKPASITSTLRRISWRATSSFSAAVRPAPGARSQGGPLRDPDRLDGALRIAVAAACERGHSDAALRLAGDPLDGLEVARRGGREAGLDHVDLEAHQLAGDLELLGRGEAGARCL